MMHCEDARKVRRSTGKSKVTMELDQLREKGLASSQSVKLNKSGASTFRSPEEAQNYLKTSTKELRARIQRNVKAPSNLSKAGLNDWYAQQKMLYTEEKKKREEAERFLRGYRQSYISEELSVGSGTTATTMSTYDTSIKGSVGGSSSGLNDTRERSKVGVLDKINIDSFTEVEHQSMEHISEDINHIEKELFETNPKEVFEKNPTTDDLSINDPEADSAAGPATGPEIESLVIKQHDDIKPESESINEKPTSSDSIDGNNANESTKDIETSTVAIEMDEENHTSISDITTNGSNGKESGSSNNKESVDDDMTDNFDEKRLIDQQSCDAGGDGDERQVPQEDENKEEIEQLQEGNPPLDNAKDETCHLDLENVSHEGPEPRFKAEADRYHLYISHACPFAHRTAIVLALKGLHETIGITYLHPTWQFTKPGVDEHRGWVFGSPDGKPLTNTNGYGSFPTYWGQEDPHNHVQTLRELYEMDNDKLRQYTVPVLWDIHLKTIVSNNSTDIMRILNSEFNEFATNPELNLLPDDMKDVIDNLNSWLYSSLNDGVYNCGLAESQDAYETAIDDVTKAFDKVESILEKQRYIAGDKITEADIRLFVTLLQFDEIYSVYFKTNTRSVSLCPTILRYVRKIYQMDGVKETCDMKMIKAHYYTSHVELNKYSIIPRGEDFLKLLQSSKSSKS